MHAPWAFHLRESFVLNAIPGLGEFRRRVEGGQEGQGRGWATQAKRLHDRMPKHGSPPAYHTLNHAGTALHRRPAECHDIRACQVARLPSDRVRRTLIPKRVLFLKRARDCWPGTTLAARSGCARDGWQVGGRANAQRGHCIDLMPSCSFASPRPPSPTQGTPATPHLPPPPLGNNRAFARYAYQSDPSPLCMQPRLQPLGSPKRNQCPPRTSSLICTCVLIRIPRLAISAEYARTR